MISPLVKPDSGYSTLSRLDSAAGALDLDVDLLRLYGSRIHLLGVACRHGCPCKTGMPQPARRASTRVNSTSTTTPGRPSGGAAARSRRHLAANGRPSSTAVGSRPQRCQAPRVEAGADLAGVDEPVPSCDPEQQRAELPARPPAPSSQPPTTNACRRDEAHLDPVVAALPGPVDRRRAAWRPRPPARSRVRGLRGGRAVVEDRAEPSSPRLGDSSRSSCPPLRVRPAGEVDAVQPQHVEGARSVTGAWRGQSPRLDRCRARASGSAARRRRPAVDKATSSPSSSTSSSSAASAGQLGVAAVMSLPRRLVSATPRSARRRPGRARRPT